MGMTCPMCGQWGSGIDPEGYLARALQSLRTTSWVFTQLIKILDADNGCHHQVTWPDFLAAEPQIKALQTAGFFADDPDDLDDSFWQMASGEFTERQEYFASCREPFDALSKILDRIFDRAPEEINQSPTAHSEFMRAIDFAIDLSAGDAATFLRSWREGDWNACAEVGFSPPAEPLNPPEE